MTLTLSPLLAAFVDAMNSYDTAAVAMCFAADAVVHDENESHRGTTEIQAWLQEVGRKYRCKMDPIEVTGTERDVRLRARVSGDFDGSPIELRYRLVVAEGKISVLAITP